MRLEAADVRVPPPLAYFLRGCLVVTACPHFGHGPRETVLPGCTVARKPSIVLSTWVTACSGPGWSGLVGGRAATASFSDTPVAPNLDGAAETEDAGCGSGRQCWSSRAR